jgi:hypothetical protein
MALSTLNNVFPSRNSVPPPCFYTNQGLAQWLNQNPTYKHYFINYPEQFPNLTITNSQSTMFGNYTFNVENVPLASPVTTLSYQQAQKYNQQLKLFRDVYAYNSTSYGNSVRVGTTPTYYRFQTYAELMNFKASVPLVNKAYPFDAMAYGQNEVGSTLGWVVPFPL